MAEDFLLDGSNNKPNPGPIPFSYQSIFDAFKSKDTKTLQLYDDNIKNLREVKTPDELAEIFSNKENRLNFFSQNREGLQNFEIFRPEDFDNKVSGNLTDIDKIQIAETSSNLRKTTVPDFGKPGFDTYYKNRQNLQAMDESAIGAFSEVVIAGLNVKHTGEEIQDYNQMREYFSNPDNYDKWQKQKFVQDGLNKNNLSAFSILERLQPKETPATAIAEAEIQNAIPQDQFFGKIDEAQVGKILDEGGDISFDENSGIYRDIEDDFMARNTEAMLSSEQGLGINEVNFVTKKEEKLNKESLNKYLTSLGMSPEEIQSYKLEKIQKYREQKFLNIDLQRNIASAEGTPINIFEVDQQTSPFANQQAMYYAFGSKNAYQQSMDKRGYDMLSEQDRKIHSKLLELDRHRRELEFYKNGDATDYTLAKQKYDKAYGDFQALKKEMGYSGFDIYDPETRQPFPQQIVAAVSEQVSQKYNKEYYAKTPLGKMKRERNALIYDVESLTNEIRTLNPESEDYQIKKELYLRKSVELYTLNRALYTNDNPMKRMSGAGRQFIDGVKEAINPDQNISRLDETLAIYNNLSRYGLVLDEKDIEEVEKNLQPTTMEMFGEGLYTTTAILVESALYSYMGMGALGAATRLKQYTRLKEGVRALYGKNGVALVNHFEKLAEFAVKGGSQLLTGQTTAGFVTEEVFEEGTDYIAKTFKKLYSNKVSAFLTRFTSGTIGSSIGEFFGNMADALLENGFDVREAFKETYGEDWETQEKQLAVIGFMSMGFAGASNIGLLIKTKQQFQYWKQQLGGEFKDELTITAERMIDEAIANYKTGTTTNQRQVENIQSEDPSALPITDPVAMSSEPIEAPQAGVSEQTESRVLEPIEEQKATELKQEEKLEVENRVAERGEVFYVVEADGTVNKDVEYRYNEESGKIESRGYTAFNNKFEEVNDDLARTVEAKVNDSGMLSKTKAEELASTKLGLDKSDRLVEIDGQVFLSRDPQTIRQDIDKKVDNVNTVAKNRFSNKVSELRNKIKDSLFSEAKTEFTPEFNDFFSKLKTSLNMRMNRTNILFKGAAYMVETSYKGLPKVADYLGSINLSFSKTKAGLDLLTEFTDKILLSKRFKDSDLSKDANATDYATNIALQMLLNEDPTVAEYFDGDKDAINAFNRFRTGFVRHAAKNFTGGTVKYNASFFNQNVNPNVEKRTEQDLDRTEQDQILVREQRRGIKRIFDMAGEGERLDLTKEENLKTVDAIRYANGELSAADFLTSVGEDVEGKTDQEITTLADTKRDEFADISKFEGWSQRLIEFSKNEKAVKKKLRKELNTNFSYVHPEFQEQVTANTLVGRIRKELAQGVRRAVNLNVTNRRKNRQSAEIMYEMLQTMALRSDRTPEQVLDETIAFQKASKEQAEQIIAQAYDSGELDVLFDFYVGDAGATYSEELYGSVKKAKELLDNGVDPRRVQLMYGALYGPDGRMRIKLAPQFRFKSPQTINKIYNAKSIGDTIELSSLIDHSELFELYPDLKKLKVTFTDTRSEARGSFVANVDYNKQADNVRMNQTADDNIFDIGVSPGEIRISRKLTPDVVIGTLKHEIQHAVQHLEGMESGSSDLITKYFVFTQAQSKSFVNDFIDEKIADSEVGGDFSGVLSEEQRFYQKEVRELGELLNEASEILSQMGANTALGSRGSMFLFANLLRVGRNSKVIGETSIASSIKDKIKSYLPLGESSQEIEQNDKNIEKLIQIVESILNGDGGIKELETNDLFDSISSFNLYKNNLGEMEARAVQQTRFDFYNFHTKLEKLIDNSFKKNIPFNRKMAKYLSDRANIKRIELAEEIRQTGAEFISPMPNSDIELMKVVDNFLSGDAAFNLKQNPEFKSFRSNIQRLTEELSDSYVNAINFLRSEGISLLTTADITFGNDLTNAYVTKLLDSRGKEKQIFEGSKKVPSFITQSALDPSAKIGQKSISNEAIEAQIKLEDELYGKQTKKDITDKTLFQNEGGTVRGAVVFEDTKATIYAMTDPTVATPLHELAHVYEKYLTEQERNEVIQAAGKDTWDRSVSEYFARGFEKFLADGVPPSTKLMTPFRKFRVWMSSVFNTFDQPETELNEEMRRIYSVMLGETPMSDVPASEISAEVSDTEQLKTELATTIEAMRKAGNTDAEIYQGLIKDGTFSAADLSDYFDLNTKQTVYNQVKNQDKFAQEAQEILEDSQHVVRSLAELNKEMANLDELEARGILYALNGLPNIDVAVAKIITQMLDNKAKGISSVEDLMLIAQTGTNVGRALQRFKMLKKQQPRLVVASLVKDLKAVGAQIPPRALKELDDSARRFMDAIEKLDNAKAANQDARYVNGTSPFDQNKSNHEYYLDSLKEWQDAKLDYSKKMQPWARKSVNLGAGKAFSEWYKTSVRLNLLTFRSLGRNFSSNLVKGALNLSVNKIATTVSLLRSIRKDQVTFKGFKYNLATAKGIKPGLKQTAEVLRFGNISDIGNKVEINGGFNGFRALVEWVGAGFAKMSGASDIEIAERFNFVLDKDGKIKNGDKFLRFAEGSLGLFSETISRAMQAGDLVFKNTAYYGAMHQEAKRRGLKTPKEIKHFMDLHMDYSDNNSFEDALTYVYANDSKAYKAVSRMFSGGGSDFYSSLWTTLVPYQKIPTNVFAEYFEFMTPMYGILSSGIKFNEAARLRRESNRQNNPTKKLLLKEQSDRANQRAEQSIGRAMTGFGLYMIAFELVKLGVLSAKSATRKEAEEKDQMGGSNRLNITLLLEELGLIESKGRTMKEFLDGDLTVELEFLGAFGAILALSQAKLENIKKDIYNKPLNVESTKVNEELQPNMNVLEILDPREASNYFGPLGYNLNLSFVKNLASFTEAIISLGESDSEDPGKIAKFIVDLSMTSVSSVLPNIMTDMTKTMQGEEGVKFDYNLKDMNGGEKILRDFGSRLNERLFRSFTEFLDPAIDRDVFNQPKKLTPKGRDPLAYQMFDLTRGDLEKGLSQTYVSFMNNKGKRPSWQDLVAFARLYNAPESVFPSLVKPIRETEKGAIKLKPTLDEIKEHKAMVLKVREQLANSVLDEMQSSGNLRVFFDMTEQMNKIKERQVPKGVLVFSNVMSSIYSRSESLVNQFMVPLIEINYINNLKIENPKAYAKYQKLMEDNIYSAYYDEITKDQNYKEALEELRRDIVQKVQDAIDNPTTFNPETIE